MVPSLSPERWRKLKELCSFALEQEPEQRADFLAAACPDDESLRRQAESMIARATHGKGVLSGPIWEKLEIDAVSAMAAPSEIQRKVPSSIGRYRVMGIVGEGGMGVVYDAEQDHPRRLP
jgi:hypothetical protein